MRAPDPLPDFAIEAKGLEKTYRAQRRPGGKVEPKRALKGIDLAIPRGSFFGLLGPNGAGKSTFINILAGLVVKSGGAARVWGHDIDEHPRQARGSIGIVPQEINQDPFFTPFETLEMQAGFYGVPKGERRTEVILKALGLWDKRDAYARTLSGGMKRRLLVAKALVHDPPVLVLDEPTAGVDVELRRQLWDYVATLRARGVTVVLTTHYLEEAQELCDTIAIIHQGEVIACEPTPQILRRLDQKVMVLHGASPIAVAPASFAGLKTDIRGDGALAITYRGGEHAMSEMLDRVRASGIVLRDISIQEPDLEDVFLALTRG